MDDMSKERIHSRNIEKGKREVIKGEDEIN
jgi:hypothetical protein